MRILLLITLAMGAVHIDTPAAAQTYDPHYPFCLQIYDDIVHYTFECAYTSMDQCRASASGRNTQCVVNPYYPRAPAKPGPRKRRSPAQQ